MNHANIKIENIPQLIFESINRNFENLSYDISTDLLLIEVLSYLNGNCIREQNQELIDACASKIDQLIESQKLYLKEKINALINEVLILLKDPKSIKELDKL